MRTIQIVVGGQFGSEAKGHVTHRLIRQGIEQGARAQDIVNIRVAGPNAGHTVITDDGTALPLRSIPVGAATPDVQLYIAPGSEVDLATLSNEIKMCHEAGIDVTRRLYVSDQVTILTTKHAITEREGGFTERMGSTSKGIGAARVDRLNRTAETPATNPEHVKRLEELGATVVDSNWHQWTVGSRRTPNTKIVIEGTQGYGLGLHAGYYPYCTSSDCTNLDFLAMARVPLLGVQPYTWVVVRPYPIRVAGNSGPLHGETTWEQLGLKPEKTTVTQKTRRVGRWDYKLVRDAILANGKTHLSVALTMADQVDPNLANTEWDDAEQLIHNSPEVSALVRAVERAGASVDLITYGPNTGTFRN